MQENEGDASSTCCGRLYMISFSAATERRAIRQASSQQFSAGVRGNENSKSCGCLHAISLIAAMKGQATLTGSVLVE
eukprot:9352020-Karenia_brevis.AAC.1